MKKLTSVICMIVFGSIFSGCALQQGVLDEKRAEMEAKNKPMVDAKPAPVSPEQKTAKENQSTLSAAVGEDQAAMPEKSEVANPDAKVDDTPAPKTESIASQTPAAVKPPADQGAKTATTGQPKKADQLPPVVAPTAK